MAMQRVSGGYTIIEVLIVVGVSAMLIMMAMVFLSGRDGQTRFSQSMRDLQAKVQEWMTDVSNGNTYGDVNSTSCKANGNSVKIDSTPRSNTAAPDCIFLGKAIQFTDAPSDKIYAYTVFGRRVDNSNNLVTDLKTAAPMPATGTSALTGTADLTETYSLNGVAAVKSITSTTSSSNKSHLAGFYLSLQNDQSAQQNGQTDLVAYQYPIGNSTLNSQNVINCIRNRPPPGVCNLGAGLNPATLGVWTICFDSLASVNQTALLTIRSNNNGLGATTKLDFVAC